MDNNSLAHSRYNCTYHIVFIPKYRRKVMFGELRKDVGEILGKVCRMEGVTIIKAATLPDHVHMYVSIPPKLSVSKAVGLIKGKSALMSWWLGLSAVIAWVVYAMSGFKLRIYWCLCILSATITVISCAIPANSRSACMFFSFCVFRPATQKLSLKWLMAFSTFTRIL